MEGENESTEEEGITMRMMLPTKYDEQYNRMLTLVEDFKDPDRVNSYRFTMPFCGHWSDYFVEEQSIILRRKERGNEESCLS